MTKLLHPCYFPNIATFALMVSEKFSFEIHDNFQKQTYRNRCYIATDRGRHMLNIPIKHVGDSQGRQRYQNVALDDSTPWQKQHWKTIQTAYRTSPFFEFYEDELEPFFNTPFERLMDFNFASITVLANCLGIHLSYEKNKSFEVRPQAYDDYRFLVNAKAELHFEQADYVQVFGDRHGFLKNLSTLDLLFNKGPETLEYLHQLAP